MSTKNVPEPKKEAPIVELIQQIKDGNVDAATLTKELRQQCVEIFVAEGYVVPTIAQILNRCDKTIRRDIAEIREQNAISPDIGLAKQIIGEMLINTRIHRDHLMRLARTKGSSVSEKAQAELYAANVFFTLISKLQTLGYLPQKPQEIVADFSHHVDVEDEKSLKELRFQVDEVEKIAKESGGMTSEMIEEIRKLKLRIDKADIETKVKKLSENKKEEKNV